MDMGQKIYYLRTQKGLTLEELGNKVGVGKSTVRKWENGMIANMRRDKILKVAEALGTSPSYLMGWEKPEPSPAVYEDNTYAGGILSGQMIPDNCLNPEKIMDSISKADFYLVAKDDSMINARIHDGDIVFVQKQEEVSNGEIAAVILNNEKTASIRRVYYYAKEKLLILKPENPSFEDLIFLGHDLKNARIIGKVIAFQSVI